MSITIVSLAVWRGSLSKSGAAGALMIGTLTFGLGGWVWGVLLGVFFVSSSLLSHFKEEEKRTAAEKFEKGHRRDIGQVFANGGLGAILAVLSALFPSPIWFFLFVGVMATVTADTWATELGTLSKTPPRLITTGEVVDVGTSGGVSWLGTAVSLTGGLLIGLAGGLLQHARGEKMLGRIALAGAIGGLVGSLTDSLLGATVQQIYYCDTCQKDTERKIHKCGTVTRPLRGWSWMNNDLVNLISSIAGGGIAVLIGLMLWRKKNR
ncbi:MAG: DUF92 domain-containing protein [Chloroflexota bacterium]